MRRSSCSFTFTFIALAIAACDGASDQPPVAVDVCSADDCAVDFGVVVVGDPEGRTLVIENPGAAAVTPTISFNGSSDPAFTIAEQPGALAAGASADLVLLATLAGDGDVKGAVVIEDGDVRIEVLLFATGLCPLTIAPTSCDFGAVAVGSEAFCEVTVTADAACEGHITLAEVNGGGVFSLADPPALPLAVPAASSTILRVRAAPTADGVAIGTFVVNGTTITLRAAS